MPIRYRLGLMIAGLSFVILSMFLVTWYTTSAQKTDGLVINLAGRQRMLSQKMSKELFSFAATTDIKEKQTLISSAVNTMSVFDVTLSALGDSGKAPLSLDLKAAYAVCPKAVEPAYSQLVKVKDLWETFSSHMKTALSEDKAAAGSLEYIKLNNLNLLNEMNTAVVMLQKISEKKVQRLIVFQTFGLIIGITLMGISILQIHTIAKKLLGSASTARKMSNGDLTRRFKTADKPESRLDEMETLGYNLNIFAQSLQENIKEIYQDANRLNNSSTGMNKVATQLSQETESSAEKISNIALNADTMSEDMNAVAAAMEELSANTQQIADSASRMSDTSKNIAQNAEKAGIISDQAVEKVDSASSRV
ncbi:MAG: methyl-accepting chemotaxis protein, partial [Proteobacteria bacterium]|nr:methyl-accepting chemotaxis protein [Pseudomonadota bacterium]